MARALCKAVISYSPPESVDTLLIDANSLLYACHSSLCKTIRDKGESLSSISAENFSTMLINDYLQRQFNLVKLHRPKKVLGLFLDGPAPLAKNDKQAQNRYIKGQQRHDDAEINGRSSDLDIDAQVSTEEFSPGTVFMQNLTKRLADFLSSYEIVNTGVQGIIFSKDTVPGEGEHKLMDLFREGLLAKQGNHVIVGSDSDIIVLSTLQEADNIYVMREARDEGMEDSWVSVKFIKLYIMDRLRYCKYPFHDFATMICFMGNDFVPTPIAMSNAGYGSNSLETLFSAHEFLFGKEKGGLCVTGDDERRPVKICLENLLKFAEHLASMERTLIEAVCVDRKGGIYDIPEHVSFAERELTGSSGKKFTTNKQGVDGFETFKDAWRKMETDDRKERILQLQAEEKRVRAKSGPDSYSLDPNLIKGITAKGYATYMGRCFITGIYWTFEYYMIGKANNSWSYGKAYGGNYAPLLCDIASVPVDDQLLALLKDVAFKGSYVTIPEQLFSILPPNISKTAVDDSLYNLIASKPKIFDHKIEYFGLSDSSYVYRVNLPTLFPLKAKHYPNKVVQLELERLSTLSKWAEETTMFFVVSEEDVVIAREEKQKFDELLAISEIPVASTKRPAMRMVSRR